MISYSRLRHRELVSGLLATGVERTEVCLTGKKVIDGLALQNTLLGKAGLVSPDERRSFVILIAISGAILMGLAVYLGGFLGIVVGMYILLMSVVMLLKHLSMKTANLVNYYLPLNLQLLSLLVQSGVCLLPAIERVVKDSEKKTPVSFALQSVYELVASGMTFQEALRLVAANSPYDVISQTILHLDLTGNEGGELSSALDNLTDHTQLKWKLSVESRVRRLENLVVFPVFMSVLGLLLLVSAGPVVPIVEFMDGLKNPI